MSGTGQWARHGPDLPSQPEVCQVQPQEEEASNQMEEHVLEGIPESSFMKIRFPAIIAENQRRAKESGRWQKSLGPTVAPPLYTEPSDTEIFQQNKKNHELKWPQIQQFIKKKLQAEKDSEEDHDNLPIGSTDKNLTDDEDIYRSKVHKATPDSPTKSLDAPPCLGDSRQADSQATEETGTSSQIPGLLIGQDHSLCIRFDNPSPDLGIDQGTNHAPVPIMQPEDIDKTIQSEPLDLSQGQSLPENTQPEEEHSRATTQLTQSDMKTLPPRDDTDVVFLFSPTDMGFVGHDVRQPRGSGIETYPGVTQSKATELNTRAPRKRPHSSTSLVCESDESSLPPSHKGLQSKAFPPHRKTKKVKSVAEHTSDEDISSAEVLSEESSSMVLNQSPTFIGQSFTQEIDSIFIKDGTVTFNKLQSENTSKTLESRQQRQTSTSQSHSRRNSHTQTQESPAIPKKILKIDENVAKLNDVVHQPTFNVHTLASQPMPDSIPGTPGVPNLHSLGVTDEDGILPGTAPPVTKFVNEKLKGWINRKGKN